MCISKWRQWSEILYSEMEYIGNYTMVNRHYIVYDITWPYYIMINA